MTTYRVLHVDDPAFLAVSRTVLGRHESIAVTGEASPEAALDRLRGGHDVDCLVSEFDHAEMGGIEFLRRVRDLDSDLPFIFFTGEDSDQVAEQAIAAGVTDYVPKATDEARFELLAHRISNYAEQYRTTRELDEIDRRNAYALQAVSDVVWERDLETGDLFVSDGFAEVTGYDPDETDITYEWWLDHIHPADRDRLRDDVERVVAANRSTFAEEYRFRGTDDAYRTVEDNGYVLYGDDGQPRRFVGAIRDVTRRKQRERELQQQNERLARYEALIERTPDSVFMFDGDRTCVYANPAAVEASRFSRDELLGKPLSALLEPGVQDTDLREQLRSVATDLIDGAQASVRDTFRFTSPDGDVYVDVNAVRVETPSGEFVGLATVLRDITDRVESEQEIRRQNERLAQYESIVETLPVGIAVLDEDATVEWVNEAFWTAFDTTEAAVTGRSFLDLVDEGLIDEAIIDRYENAVRELLSTDSDTDRATVEIDLYPPQRDDVRQYEGYVALQPFDEDGYAGTVNAFIDVTEQKQRQRELEQYKVAMETVPDGVFLLDADGRMTRVNQAWADLVGYDADALVGEPFTKLVEEDVIDPFIVERYLDVVSDRSAAADAEHKAKFTTEVTHSDGTEHVYEVNIGLITAASGDEFQGTAGVVRDITDKVEQQRQLERENERLDDFASIVSHDLRNPLAVARGFAHLAQETDDDAAELGRVLAALDRMDAIIADVLTLARQGLTIAEPEPVELVERFEACWESVETKEATARIECDRAVRVAADAARLQQVFENLVRNAVEHGGDDVTVTLGRLENGFYVEDDGAGFPAGATDDVFEAGFSGQQDGTGLGLNIVERIVEAHGWEIVARDGTDGGARFEISGVEFVDE